jgi:hypothetical protein
MGEFVWIQDLTRVLKEKTGFDIKPEDVLAIRRRQGGLEVLYRWDGTLHTKMLTSAVNPDG